MRSKTIIKQAIFALGIAVLFGVYSATATSAQGVLKEVLKRMDGNNKSLTSFTSSVRMEKRDSVLDETDVNTGKVNYLPKSVAGKMYVRIDWVKPEENMVVIGDDYKIYRKVPNQLIVGKTNSAKSSGKAGNALAFISMSQQELQANYSVSYVQQETLTGGVETWHILLTPKTKSSYKTADLWVDKDGMPRQARITENNNDTTIVLLSDIQKNQKINGAVFALDPKGAKVVKA